MVFLISARSESVSGLTPPLPSRTSSEPASTSTFTEDLAGSAESRVTSACQRVTSMVRSCPAFAPSPVRLVLISSWPDSGPSVYMPSDMSMAAGYAHAEDYRRARSRPNEKRSDDGNVTIDISEAYPGSDDLFVIHREDDLANVMLNAGTVLVSFASTVTSLLPGSPRLETTSAAPVMFSCCVGAQRDGASATAGSAATAPVRWAGSLPRDWSAG